jgi:hypothetical protein
MFEICIRMHAKLFVYRILPCGEQTTSDKEQRDKDVATGSASNIWQCKANSRRDYRRTYRMIRREERYDWILWDSI